MSEIESSAPLTSSDQNGSECICQAKLSGVLCGESQTLKIIDDLNRLYEEQLLKFGNVPTNEHEQLRENTLRLWVRDLGEQNSLLVQTVEELEQEMVNRVRLLEEKLQETSVATRGYMTKAQDYNNQLIEGSQSSDEDHSDRIYRLKSDINNLCQLVSQGQQMGDWSINAMKFYEVTHADIFGSSYAVQQEVDVNTDKDEVTHLRDLIRRNVTGHMSDIEINKMEELVTSLENKLTALRQKPDLENLEKHNLMKDELNSLNAQYSRLSQSSVSDVNLAQHELCSQEMQIKYLENKLANIIEESLIKDKEILHLKDDIVNMNSQSSANSLELAWYKQQITSLEQEKVLTSQLSELKNEKIFNLRKEIEKLSELSSAAKIDLGEFSQSQQQSVSFEPTLMDQPFVLTKDEGNLMREQILRHSLSSEENFISREMTPKSYSDLFDNRSMYRTPKNCVGQSSGNKKTLQPQSNLQTVELAEKHCDCEESDYPADLACCDHQKMVNELNSVYKELRFKAQENSALMQAITEIEKSSKDTQAALTSEVAEKHDQISLLRRELQQLEEQCHQAAMQTNFKDGIIKEMRKEIKFNRTKIAELEHNMYDKSPEMHMSIIAQEETPSQKIHLQIYKEDNSMNFVQHDSTPQEHSRPRNKISKFFVANTMANVPTSNQQYSDGNPRESSIKELCKESKQDDSLDDCRTKFEKDHVATDEMKEEMNILIDDLKHCNTQIVMQECTIKELSEALKATQYDLKLMQNKCENTQHPDRLELLTNTFIDKGNLEPQASVSFANDSNISLNDDYQALKAAKSLVKEMALKLEKRETHIAKQNEIINLLQNLLKDVHCELDQVHQSNLIEGQKRVEELFQSINDPRVDMENVAKASGKPPKILRAASVEEFRVKTVEAQAAVEDIVDEIETLMENLTIREEKMNHVVNIMSSFQQSLSDSENEVMKIREYLDIMEMSDNGVINIAQQSFKQIDDRIKSIKSEAMCYLEFRDASEKSRRERSRKLEKLQTELEYTQDEIRKNVENYQSSDYSSSDAAGIFSQSPSKICVAPRTSVIRNYVYHGKDNGVRRAIEEMKEEIDSLNDELEEQDYHNIANQQKLDTLQIHLAKAQQNSYSLQCSHLLLQEAKYEYQSSTSLPKERGNETDATIELEEHVMVEIITALEQSIKNSIAMIPDLQEGQEDAYIKQESLHAVREILHKTGNELHQLKLATSQMWLRQHQKEDIIKNLASALEDSALEVHSSKELLPTIQEQQTIVEEYLSRCSTLEAELENAQAEILALRNSLEEKNQLVSALKLTASHSASHSSHILKNKEELAKKESVDDLHKQITNQQVTIGNLQQALLSTKQQLEELQGKSSFEVSVGSSGSWAWSKNGHVSKRSVHDV